MKAIVSMLILFSFQFAFAYNPLCMMFLSSDNLVKSNKVDFDSFSIERTINDHGLHYIYSDFKLKNGIELRKDSTGITISAQNSETRQSIQDFLLGSRGRSSVIFADINFLGHVNYFSEGARSGDAYIKAVAKALVIAAGDKGVVFRWGGDEFVIVLNHVDLKFLNEFGDRVVSIISDKSSDARQVFRKQLVDLLQEHKAIQQAKSYTDIPEALWSKFYSQEIDMAKSNFQVFRSDYLNSSKERFKTSRKMQPSVSLGAAVNLNENVLLNAENASVELKKMYRQSRGLDNDLEKYIGRPNLYPTTSSSEKVNKVPNIIIY